MTKEEINNLKNNAIALILDSKNLQELENSFSLEKKKIRLLLASWGYTGPGDEKIAKDHGFGVINQEDLIALLDKDTLSAEKS